MVFLAIQSLLSVPVLFEFLRTPPDVFYPRIHGGPVFELFDSYWAPWIDVVEDEIGFTREIGAPAGVEWPVILPGEALAAGDALESGDVTHWIVVSTFDAEFEVSDTPGFLFMITPEYVYYLDRNAMMAVPVNRIPAWVFNEMNLREMFNHLALYNRYFSVVVMPVFLLVFVVFFVSQLLICIAAIWLFGQWRKLSGKMTVRERFSVISFASVPAGIIGMFVGFAFPVIHILIFQLIMIYVSYKAMKEF